ncbi:ceramide-1-phosphate transfer [Brachionus plicatilis]|uniref:Ceramide-1-phosphate transfer n=1 Tax=Brachionus plicatilis TaxID=10195 RepID=A0A3M7QS02_BRAPC|nr:ceramide-1-phosphate transfer [Brachionus plicatilis]
MSNHYNAKIALEALKVSFVDNETSLDLKKFIIAYKELMKFFDHLGKVFGFVVHDISDKFHKIEKTIAKDAPNNNYATVHSAIEYEKANDIYMKEKKVTLSLLRLMRGLDFLRKFIEAIYYNQNTPKKSHELAWEVYEQTLAFRHKHMVRSLVKTGVHLLPKKQELYLKLTYGAEGTNFDDLFKDFSNTLEKAYSILYKLYNDNNFLELVLA